jgi:low temperature requirement protein LtrA
LRVAAAHNHRTDHHRMLRERVPGEHARVSTFELFFDLVFVFAVTQLSHTLAGHLDAEGLLHSTILLMAIWWVWVYTTWATNFCDPDHLAVRLVLVAIMFGGLIMSAAIPQAFDGRGFAFAIPYVAIQVGRSAFVMYAGREDAAFRLNFLRITSWLAFAGVFWVAGAAVHDGARVALWIVALAVEYAGPPARFWLPGFGASSVSDWRVEGAHMAERCGLFMIIALGESLLVTGATFSGHPWTTGAVVGMMAAFATAVAMWWIYFDATAEAGSERIGHAEEPGALARLAYTYIHLPMVAGIVVVAVGDELALAHPHGETSLSEVLTIVGGPFIFLVGYVLFKRAVMGRFFPFHTVLFGALAAAFFAREVSSPVVLTCLTTAVLVAGAVRGRLGHASSEPSFEFEGESVSATQIR